MKRTEPTRHLYAGHRYVNSANTNIRATFNRIREQACPPFPTLDTSMPCIDTATTEDGSAFVRRFMRSVGLRSEVK